MNYQATTYTPVIRLDADARGAFIARTYTTLFGAVLALVGLEIALFKSGLAESIAMAASGSWLLFLGGFMVVSWLARGVAHKAQSQVAQIAALAGYVAAQGVILAPLLYIAQVYYPGITESAALVTLAIFAALTGVVFWTRKDFSFMGAMLRFAGIGALILIVAALIFGFQLGVFFSVAMVVLAGGSILYDTSNVLHHYPSDKHTAAALELFASLAMLFWYVLRIFMSRD